MSDKRLHWTIEEKEMLKALKSKNPKAGVPALTIALNKENNSEDRSRTQHGVTSQLKVMRRNRKSEQITYTASMWIL
jgi:hypothetical protein